MMEIPKIFPMSACECICKTFHTHTGFTVNYYVEKSKLNFGIDSSQNSGNFMYFYAIVCLLKGPLQILQNVCLH